MVPGTSYACASCRTACVPGTCDYHVSGSGAIFDAELCEVCVIFGAELGCRHIRMRVVIDKNVDARHECFTYIPDQVLPRRAPDLPHNSYSDFNSAFKTASARAFPDPVTRTTPLDCAGSHSVCKYFAQWLWDRYMSAWVIIAHAGHWACRRDAMDAYSKKSATAILRLIAAL
eukprot:jgi/Tetstr1/457247/TSEL_004176.t1